MKKKFMAVLDILKTIGTILILPISIPLFFIVLMFSFILEIYTFIKAKKVKGEMINYREHIDYNDKIIKVPVIKYLHDGKSKTTSKIKYHLTYKENKKVTLFIDKNNKIYSTNELVTIFEVIFLFLFFICFFIISIYNTLK